MNHLKIPLTLLGHLSRANGYNGRAIEFVKELSNSSITEVEVVHAIDKPPLQFRNGEKKEPPRSVKVPQRLTVKAILIAINNKFLTLESDGSTFIFHYNEGNIHMFRNTNVGKLRHLSFGRWIEEGKNLIETVEQGKMAAEAAVLV